MKAAAAAVVAAAVAADASDPLSGSVVLRVIVVEEAGSVSKAIEKGCFVQNEGHPEYGVGRVLEVGAFATRVLFPNGGLRVFRVEATQGLKTVAAPAAGDVELLAQKEAAMASGIFDHLGRPIPEPPKKRTRAPKKAVPA